MPAKKVRLFYLGGLSDDGKSHPIDALGRMIHLPKVGEAIELADWRAEWLINKYRLAGRDGNLYEIFTTDAAKARLVAKTGLLPKMDGAIAPEDMPTDALVEILQKRGINIQNTNEVQEVEPVPLQTPLEEEIVDQVGSEDWPPPSPLENEEGQTEDQDFLEEAAYEEPAPSPKRKGK